MSAQTKKVCVMNHSEGTFQAAGGLELYYQKWQPERAPRAILAIVHGFGEHSGRYDTVVNHLISRGFAIYGFDHRGHGRSPGQRGHINAWDEYRGDVNAFLKTIRAQNPQEAIFLMGHSMGALIVLDYILRGPEKLAGTIVSGTPIEPVGFASPFLMAVARILSRIWPGCPIKIPLEAAMLSRDADVVAAYQQDPLVHSLATPRWGTESQKTIQWLKSHPQDLQMPILMIHGGSDPINTIAGCQDFFEKVSYADKQLLVYPGSYHEPHNDLDHKQVVEDLEKWLTKHL